MSRISTLRNHFIKHILKSTYCRYAWNTSLPYNTAGVSLNTTITRLLSKPAIARIIKIAGTTSKPSALEKQPKLEYSQKQFNKIYLL